MFESALIFLTLLQPPQAPMPIDVAKAQLVAQGYSVGIGGVEGKVAIAAYDSRFRAIFLNPAHEYWLDRRVHAVRDFEMHHLSTPHVDHVLRHEVGHAVLHKAVGDTRFFAHCNRPPPLSRDRIRATVSIYACNTAAEFHAEVYAAIKDGKTFEADVMAAYEEIGRP